MELPAPIRDSTLAHARLSTKSLGNKTSAIPDDLLHAMNRVEGTFLALVLVQGAHSVEEYFGKLWEVFPPARFLTGLVSDDRHLGFLVLNVGLFLFGMWCFLWPVRRRWPSGRIIVGAWIVLEIINGIGHPLWSLRQGGYTAGVATAPILLILALALLWQRKAGAIATRLEDNQSP
ncbi:MAG: HXXEE domain-containing protein [Opitutus sp.]